MTDLTEKTFTVTQPKAAIIVYEEQIRIPEKAPKSTGNRSLEVRPVRSDGTLGAGRPVSRKFICDLLKSFSAEDAQTPHGPMPDNVLYADYRPGREKFIWYTPPGKRMRYFQKELGLKDGDYCVPGCLYVASGGSLQVYAFAGRKPRGTTRLLWGPFFNQYDDHVCLGNAKARTGEITWEGIQTYWESLFWNSIDSHMGSIRGTKENLVLTIKKYRDSPFDCKELVPTKFRLNNLLK